VIEPTASMLGTFALMAIGGYLLGSIPFGVILTRLGGAGDVRSIGSGNIGATNVLRTGRKDLAIATLLLDAGKGAAALLLAKYLRSNVALLSMMGARVRLIGPPTLVPGDADRWGCEVFHDMKDGLQGCDVVMMLRLQLERMEGTLVPSTREYFRFWGLDREKLAFAKPGARVMHPGPMNRGVEIDSDVADDLSVSLIQDQVEMGVAARMAVLAALSVRLDGEAA